MKTLKPAFYDQFECQGGTCLYHCCQCWGIIVDNETMKKYSNYTGSLKETAQQQIKLHDNGMYFIEQDQNKQCPFLDQNELCEIVKQKGPDDLSYTCTVFPRSEVVTLDTREKSLSIGCPHVVHFLQETPAPLSFICQDDGIPADLESSLSSSEQKIIEIDLWIRDQLIDCIQLQKHPLWLRLFSAHAILEEIQDSHNTLDYEKIAKTFGAYMSEASFENTLHMATNDITFDKHLKFELLVAITSSLKDVLTHIVGPDKRNNAQIVKSIYDSLDTITYNDFIVLEENTRSLFKDNENFFENVIVFLIYEQILKSFDKNYLLNNYHLILIIFMLFKFSIQLYMFANKTISNDTIIVILAVIGRCFLHCKPAFKNLVESFIGQSWWTELEILGYLIES